MRRTKDDPAIWIVDDAPIRIVAADDDEMRDGETLHVRMSVMDDAMVVRGIAVDASAHAPGFRTGDAADVALEAYRRVIGGQMLHDDLRARVSDAAVRDARQEMIDRATSAWRMDARRVRKPAPDDDDDPDANNDEPEGSGGQYNRQHRSRRKIGQTALPFESHADARDAYVRRLTDAWRHPPSCDAAEPDLGSRPEDPRAPSGVTDPDRAASIEEWVERTRGRIWNDYKTALENAWKHPPGVMPPQRADVAAGPSSTIAGVASPDPAVRTQRVSSGPGPVSMVRESKR
jgi:hypothetical protein